MNSGEIPMLKRRMVSLLLVSVLLLGGGGVLGLITPTAYGDDHLVPEDPAKFHLFLLVGQSNMAGRGKVQAADRLPHENVLMLDRSEQWVPAIHPLHFDKRVAGVGLGKSFAIDYANEHPGVTVGLIPCAVGGSPISTWEPDATHAATKAKPYDDALRRSRAALKTGTLKGILWHQGESDSKPGLAEVYESKFHDLIARLRNQLQAPDVPFVAGQMGQFSERPWSDSRKIVDAAHRSLPAKVARSGFVSSDGLSHKGDQTHFDVESCRELGHRYYSVFRSITKDPGKPGDADQDVGTNGPSKRDVDNLGAAAGRSGESVEVSRASLGARFSASVEQLLANMKHTDYQHLTEIDVESGSLLCDCSGLVGYVLRHQFPEAYLALRGDEAPWRKRPVAVTYYQTFVSASDSGQPTGQPTGPWMQVHKMADIQPGDVLAWRKKKIERGSTSGHVCMIAGSPVTVGEGLVRVRVIDSTRSPHANDSRPPGTTGVGAGEKTFIVNDAGGPIGYLVGDRPVKTRVAVGRLLGWGPQQSVRQSVRAVNAGAGAGSDSDVRFIGLPKADAVRLAESSQMSWRIIRDQGQAKAVKWLIREDRLNFVIRDGRVVRVIRG